jgi:hypothetical protein
LGALTEVGDGVDNVIGGLGIVVTGVIGFGAAGDGVADAEATAAAVLAGPNRLAARIYCAKAACCSGVAVFVATACRIALNSGLAAAISVSALTVRLFAMEVDGGGGVGVGVGVGLGTGGGGGALTDFGTFSAFSSTLRTDRKRVSGNI